MKSLRYTTLILMLLTSIILQSCGSGGAGKETNGSLTMSNLTVAGPTGGVYTITETIQYLPTAGKVPNGLAVDVTIVNPNNVLAVPPLPVVTTTRYYLNSSGGFTLTDFALQGPLTAEYSVTATTGDLVASGATILAGVAPLNATPSPIVFAASDTAGTVKTSTIAGGFTPYAVTANTSPDLVATIAGTTLSVTKTSVTGAVQKQGTITVTDGAGSTIDILVFYF